MLQSGNERGAQITNAKVQTPKKTNTTRAAETVHPSLKIRHWDFSQSPCAGLPPNFTLTQP
jgi:hypothetical protein